ncbi:hypothetical protein E4P29_25510 [Rhodococcus sp. 1R11]|uniref:hypothetical protein n=1 Tax=Rhodococcus sp. 1R11 TaxID=2559614 RepID=UPI0010719A70|nr:hypothetical protein [Rhodococcus sp. 1R11]TFI40272.1 hypothetical protein E4P29_25510 [Rhodococcus sp. 1R11]
MAVYIDPDGNEVVVTQKAGRRSLERLGYTLIEADPEDWDVAEQPPVLTPPGSAPEARYTDVLTRDDLHGTPPAAPVVNDPPAAVVNDPAERGDLGGGVVETEQAPLGVKLEPDAQPSGEPAPWVAEAEQAAAELDEAPVDAEPVAPQPEPGVEPEPEPDPEPKPAPAKRTGGRRGSKAASDD